jgi:hypothetical protein
MFFSTTGPQNVQRTIHGKRDGKIGIRIPKMRHTGSDGDFVMITNFISKDLGTS